MNISKRNLKTVSKRLFKITKTVRGYTIPTVTTPFKQYNPPPALPLYVVKNYLK
jgi:hypothetical protein